jgi:hypothetical protein
MHSAKVGQLEALDLDLGDACGIIFAAEEGFNSCGREERPKLGILFLGM